MAGLRQPRERPMRQGHREQKWRAAGGSGNGAAGLRVLWGPLVSGDHMGRLCRGEGAAGQGVTVQETHHEDTSSGQGDSEHGRGDGPKMAKLMLHPKWEQNPVSTSQ